MKQFLFLLLCGVLLAGLTGFGLGIPVTESHASHGGAPAVAPAEGHAPAAAPKGADDVSVERFATNLAKTTGIYGFLFSKEQVKFRGGDVWVAGWHKLMMLIIGGILLYLGVAKNFEPLLLVPIGFGTVLVNIPFAGMGDEGGFLKIIFDFGINNEFFPLIIFMGIGALTDFGPLIANPRTALLGAAAQFGVFGTLLGAVALNAVPGISYTLKEACSISIIGGADDRRPFILQRNSRLISWGPLRLRVFLYGAGAAHPPPIMRALTTPEVRKIRMKQHRRSAGSRRSCFR
jgi:oxaloacetate decarboxylase beta subunit